MIYYFEKNGVILNSILAESKDIAESVANGVNVIETTDRLGVGYTYSEEHDAYIYGEKPFDSWVWNKRNGSWTAPVAPPNDELNYQWNEELVDWEAVDFSE